MVEFPADKEFPDVATQNSEIQAKLKEPLEVGQTWYVIDAKWFKTFKYFVGIEGSERAASNVNINPGPIDNSLLLDGGSGELKPGLVEILDYVLIPASAWDLLHTWYGLKVDQSPIARKVINLARPPKVELKVEVYKVKLHIYNNSKFQDSFTYDFSQADQIRKIEEISKEMFVISSDEKVQVQCFYGPNQSQVLSKDHTIHEESLNSDFKIVVEAVNEEEEPKNFIKPALPKNKDVARVVRMTPKNNRAVGSGYVTRHAALNNSTLGSAEGRGPPCIPGLCGLMNLGNTCFLNSIIQCLSNCGPITQYFLDGRHEHEINATNPLGRAGQIASSFADVISMMWSGKHLTAVPHYFKLQLTKFAPQFAGCQQHDAQELLTFLLDGLHEDLNRVKDKPYYQDVESDLKDDQALARESWDYFRQRNDSIIIDYFHGMLKSRVVCPDCEKVSIKFDTFSTLSLPLPLRCDRTILVRYVPYNQKQVVTDLLILVPKKGTIRDMATELSKVTDVKPDLMVIAEVSKSHFHKFYSMDDTIEQIEERDKIYMYDLPRELVGDEESKEKHTILPVVLWEVSDPGNLRHSHFLSSLFGTPFIMVLPHGPLYFKTLYDKICEHLTRSCESFLKLNQNYGCFSMDIDAVESCSSRSTNNRLFTPVMVNNFCYEIKTIEDEDYDLFEVPENFGRELLALQIQRHVKLEYYKETPVPHEEFTNSYRLMPKLTLEDCLTLFTTTEKLGENNAWHCPNCNKKKRATKKLDLWKLPNILVFHLKRFAFNETKKEKLLTKVEFPLTGLNIDDYVVNKHKENLIYDLIGVCNHYGTLMSGHYTAMCKSYRDGKWYCFDDTIVTPVSSDRVQAESAYVLFYQQRPSHD